jgi:hypothetical protein
VNKEEPLHIKRKIKRKRKRKSQGTDQIIKRNGPSSSVLRVKKKKEKRKKEKRSNRVFDEGTRANKEDGPE